MGLGHFGGFCLCGCACSPCTRLHSPHVSAGSRLQNQALGWPGGAVPPALDTPELFGGFFADIQDDQVVEAVSRDKKRELPLEQILVLTEENFHSSLSEAARTVVLFYASCEYELWPGCPFCNFGMFSVLSMILERSWRQVWTINLCHILSHGQGLNTVN